MEQLVELILLLNNKISNKIPEINSGGCGIFASLMYEHLTKLGYKPNIVILDYKDKVASKKNTLNNVLNNNQVDKADKKSTSFAHCCLEISGLYFDGRMLGKNLLDEWSYKGIGGKYTIEELDVALKIGSWNSMYERRRRNPTLRAVIKNSINQVYYGS